MELPPDQQQIYVSIWEKVVDTQMHFNEMSVKARQFGLTFVAAALGLGVVLMSRGQEFMISVPLGSGFDIHAVVILILAGAFALYAVRMLDLNVYHKMLRGSVTFGEDFEEHYMKRIFDLEKGMTEAISHFSRHSDAKVDRKGPKYHYTGSDMRNAETKIRMFYNVSISLLIGTAAVLFLLTAHFGHSTLAVSETTAPASSAQSAPPAPTASTNGRDANAP